MKFDERIQKAEDLAHKFDLEKGDDIEIIGDEIWLMSNGKPIGDPIPNPSTTDNKWDEL